MSEFLSSMGAVALNDIRHYDYNYNKNICYDIKDNTTLDQRQFTNKLHVVKEQLAMLIFKQSEIDDVDDKLKNLQSGITDLKEQFESENPDMLVDIFVDANKISTLSDKHHNKLSDANYSMEIYYKPVIEDDSIVSYDLRYLEDIDVKDILSIEA